MDARKLRIGWFPKPGNFTVLGLWDWEGSSFFSVAPSKAWIAAVAAFFFCRDRLQDMEHLLLHCTKRLRGFLFFLTSYHGFPQQITDLFPFGGAKHQGRLL